MAGGILSGLLLAACYAPLSLGPLALAALAPAIATLPVARRHRATVLGLLLGVTFAVLAFHWVLPTVGRMQQASISKALPFFVGFCLWQGLQLATFALIASRVSRLDGVIASAAAVASSWVLLEWGWPRVLPWALADPLAPWPSLTKIAEVGGAHGLSWVIAFVNALLAQAWINRSRPADLVRLAGIAAGVVALLYGYGHLSRDSGEIGPQVDVAVLQASLPAGADDLEQANKEAWAAYSGLTTSLDARDTPDLVIWPETVLRTYLRHDSDFRARVAQLIGRSQVPLLLGSLDLPDTDPGSGEYNSAYLFQPDSAGAVAIYHKRQLLPFGEYFPGASLVGRERWRTTGRFLPGADLEPGLMTLTGHLPKPVSFAPSICFEALTPGVYNRAVRAGAGFLVNITDDGWFPGNVEPEQHLNGVRLRAVETGRWLVRASNSGISAFISPRGEIVSSLRVGARGSLRESIALSHSTTPYVMLGNWVPLFAGIHVGWTLIANRRRASADHKTGAGVRS